MDLINLKIYNFINLDLYFLKKYNIFFLKTFLGIFFYYLPSYYFYKNNDNNLSFIFLKNFYFKSFVSNFFNFYNNINYIYVIRLKIKGLGYQIYKLTENLYSFHFHFINFFYLFLPLNIITCWYKKRMILISNDLIILKIVFKCILILKKLGPYRLLGIRYPRQIIIFKNGGKSKLK